LGLIGHSRSIGQTADIKMEKDVLFKPSFSKLQ